MMVTVSFPLNWGKKAVNLRREMAIRRCRNKAGGKEVGIRWLEKGTGKRLIGLDVRAAINVGRSSETVQNRHKIHQ